RVHLRGDAYPLAMDAHLRQAVDELPPERAGRLEADDDHVAFRPPEVVLEVMQHASAIRHARAGDDDRTAPDVVDGARLLTAFREHQVGQRRHATEAGAQTRRLFVETIRMFPV